MTCEVCDTARGNPAFPMHCPTCVWCGARLIQRLRGLPRPRQEIAARQRRVLSDWVAHGHAEELLRSLARATAVPLAPIAGRESSGARGDPSQARRR